MIPTEIISFHSTQMGGMSLRITIFSTFFPLYMDMILHIEVLVMDTMPAAAKLKHGFPRVYQRDIFENAG